MQKLLDEFGLFVWFIHRAPLVGVILHRDPTPSYLEVWLSWHITVVPLTLSPSLDNDMTQDRNLGQINRASQARVLGNTWDSSDLEAWSDSGNGLMVFGNACDPINFEGSSGSGDVTGSVLWYWATPRRGWLQCSFPRWCRPQNSPASQYLPLMCRKKMRLRIYLDERWRSMRRVRKTRAFVFEGESAAAMEVWSAVEGPEVIGDLVRRA